MVLPNREQLHRPHFAVRSDADAQIESPLMLVVVEQRDEARVLPGGNDGGPEGAQARERRLRALERTREQRQGISNRAQDLHAPHAGGRLPGRGKHGAQMDNRQIDALDLRAKARHVGKLRKHASPQLGVRRIARRPEENALDVASARRERLAADAHLESLLDDLSDEEVAREAAHLPRRVGQAGATYGLLDEIRGRSGREGKNERLSKRRRVDANTRIDAEKVRNGKRLARETTVGGGHRPDVTSWSLRRGRGGVFGSTGGVLLGARGLFRLLL